MADERGVMRVHPQVVRQTVPVESVHAGSVQVSVSSCARAGRSPCTLHAVFYLLGVSARRYLREGGGSAEAQVTNPLSGWMDETIHDHVSTRAASCMMGPQAVMYLTSAIKDSDRA